METFMLVISEPFTWGLVVGLFLLAMVWRLMRKDIVMLRSEKNRLQQENKELQSHLNTQLKINAKGNDQLEADLVDLREQNENLRSNLNLAKQRPGRAELRHLHLMENAVGVMREQAPGFAPAWEKAMRDAEAAELAAEGGLKKLMRKVLPTSKSAPAITAKDSVKDSAVADDQGKDSE